ncbi:MAG: nucleotidyl transferase AbiEii/AbiGii toxin family protein [Kiritimatiellia bacterium]|jgi:predicted nucleotidyltransferase component of viral defense system
MREEALALAREKADPAQKLNVLREYVQACVLRSLHESEAFLCLSFVGGTALRFLYNLPRFSEDLDFSLEMKAAYEPIQWMEKVKRDLAVAGFDVSATWNERKTVHVAWFRFAGLLQQAGVSGMAGQKLTIKLEVDTRPPAGAVTATEIVNRHHLMFALRHHDLPSLMAGKVHALLVRPYPKGRDWYDLLWYRAQRPPVEPNRTLLQNALDQTEGDGTYDAKDWRALVRQRLASLDAATLRTDVAPFLERPVDARWLDIPNLESLLDVQTGGAGD